MKIIIGIDPGVKTGYAEKDLESGKYIALKTTTLLEAQIAILNTKKVFSSADIFLVFEDARLRTKFGNTGKERHQGAGSIKRDSKIWEEFCQLHGIQYAKVLPKPKITAQLFQKMTGWIDRTSQHARDAAMLIDGITEKNLKLINFIKTKTAEKNG